MAKKELWLYKITKQKLFWNSNKEYEFWNFNICRRLRGYKKYARLAFDCRKLLKKGIKIKQLPKQNVSLYDSWDNEKLASAWNERRNWKRNSKRKHQWKGD